MSKKLLIPLLTKGATNHLYRQEVITALSQQGMEVVFLVREDYWDVLERFPDCTYICYIIPVLKGWRQHIVGFCSHVRYLFPSSDPWRKWRYREQLKQVSLVGGRLFETLLYLLAGNKWCIELLICVEGWVFNRQDCHDLDVLEVDGVLVLGVGAFGDGLASRITWWARKKGVPTVHFVANYDGLSSKGYRGYPVDTILVWGEQMEKDAIAIHNVSPESVFPIGSLRYNLIPSSSSRSRQKYFLGNGLDSKVKTIAFAGSAYEFHYFEMLSTFQIMKEKSKQKLQLILRVYPNQYLLNSAFMDTLLSYVKQLDDVWVSVGDPNYSRQGTEHEVLQIDEEELWNILDFSDVIINIFSTLTIEACIFDKPIINMWYFSRQARSFQQPVYFPYPLTKHIGRVLDSGAAYLAKDREQLIEMIYEGITNPHHHTQQRRELVRCECGDMDGDAPVRLALHCTKALNKESCSP